MPSVIDSHPKRPLTPNEYFEIRDENGDLAAWGTARNWTVVNQAAFQYLKKEFAADKALEQPSIL